LLVLHNKEAKLFTPGARLKAKIGHYCTITLKLCEIRRKLLLFANRKWYKGFVQTKIDDFDWTRMT